MTVANKVQGPDGVWRTIDSRSLYRSAVAFSELYQVLVADEVTRRVGLGWELRGRGGGGRPGRELAAVPEGLCSEFSQRSARIEAAVDEQVAAYRAAHGGAPPTQRGLWRIRQAAVLSTRSGKRTGSLADAAAMWRERASRVLGRDAGQWARETAPARQPQAVWLRADDVTASRVRGMAARVVDEVAGRRSVWTRWNLAAETARQIAAAGWQFADPADAVTVRDRITAAAEAVSVSLAAPVLASVPDRFRDPATGRSQFAPDVQYTSSAVLAAEDRLVALAGDAGGPRVNPARAERVAQLDLPGRGHGLDVEDQAPAAIAVTTSGRVLEVLVGPAGTGKTITMAGVRAIWEAEYGPGSVVGLALSAKAAQVLAVELGVVTDNTAQWLAQQDIQPARAERLAALRSAAGQPAGSPAAAIKSAQAEYDRWRLRPGQLLIVDEAGMAGTFALDRLAAQAHASGAKLLLVGDAHQLSPVETGGAFGMLAAARPDTAQLHVIRRFAEPDGTRRRWEEEASLGVRLGRAEVIDAYTTHDRLRGGDRHDMVDAAYTARRADSTAGKVALLIAGDNATVRELNERAQADLIAAGAVYPGDVPLRNGLAAGRGDRIVTREISRYLADGTSYTPAGRAGRRADGYVRNGQQWIVQDARPDGSLTVRLAGADGAGSASVTLPAAYVAEHVELAYATTAHRAQGMTVDTSHTIADEVTAREVLYVAMTRGRLTNTVYAVTGRPEADHDHGPAEPAWTVRELLTHILRRSTAEPSARQTIAAVQDAAGSLATLVAEYETIAAAGHELAAADLLHAAGLPAAAELVSDPEFTEVAAVLRSVQTWRLPTEALAGYLASHPADSATGVAEQIRTWRQTQTTGNTRPARRMIGGIVPDASNGIPPGPIGRALAERAALIEARVTALTERAFAERPAWLATLPHPGAGPGERSAHTAAVRRVAVYRDRWQIPAGAAAQLGPEPSGAGISQQADYRHAAQAVAALTTRRPDQLALQADNELQCDEPGHRL